MSEAPRRHSLVGRKGAGQHERTTEEPGWGAGVDGIRVKDGKRAGENQIPDKPLETGSSRA